MTKESPAAGASAITLDAVLRRSARVFAERIAVVGSGLILTYRELDQRTDRLAAAMQAAGLKRGDRVAVLSSTRPEFIEVYVAAAKLGITVVGLNFRLALDELKECLALSGPKMLFGSPEFSRTLDTLAIGRCVRFGETAADEQCAYAALLRAAPALQAASEPSPDDIHSIVFTSGTTGKPKAAMISQQASAIRALRVAQWYALTPGDGMVGWLPLYHTSLETVTATLLSGGRWATFEKPDIAQMYAAIETHRLSWIPLLPGVFNDFVDYANRGAHDLSSLRFGFGYANMMPQLVKRFTAEFGVAYWDCYGQTESSFLVAQGLIRPGDEPTFRKQPAPLMDIRIVDDDMRDVPLGTPGECVVRGPSVMSGYVANPAADAEVFRGGWLHTGDVLLRHDDGSLSFVDRLKYLIKTGGENVYPAEVEQVIGGHAAVREVCVVSVADERWGETIKAFVVTHPGRTLTREELGQWCRERLAGFKRPHYAEFLDSKDLPRSITGKIQRHELEKRPVAEEQRVPGGQRT